MVKFELYYQHSSGYNVLVNNQYCGFLEVKEDGYYDWYPELKPGYIPSWVLRQIADKLDEINHDWNEQVKQDVG